jgi:phosphotransferase system HPr (HPr) family protein
VVPASSEVKIRLPDEVALHARPAGLFVKTAMRFQAQLRVEANGKAADAKSILAVLALGAQGGSDLTLIADGPDADLALDALSACVAGLVE